jgi:hypothetical protein
MLSPQSPPPASPRPSPDAVGKCRSAAQKILAVFLLAFALLDVDSGGRGLGAAPVFVPALSSGGFDDNSGFDDGGVVDGRAPVHAFTCVYARDWRFVLEDRPSPVFLGGQVRILAHPLHSLTLILSDVLEGHEAEAENAFSRICVLLASEGRVRHCRTVRLADIVSEALAHFSLTPDRFGTEAQFRRSICPLVATYMEAMVDFKGKGPRKAMASAMRDGGVDPSPPALVLFWEGDVSITRPLSWIEAAATFVAAAPDRHVLSSPCWPLRDQSYCRRLVNASWHKFTAPKEWSACTNMGFSQQLFALSATSLLSIEWDKTDNLSDGTCGLFPDFLSFEHRACRWGSQMGWTRFLHKPGRAAYVHTGLNIRTLDEVSEVLRKEGWPWEPEEEDEAAVAGRGSAGMGRSAMLSSSNPALPTPA